MPNCQLTRKNVELEVNSKVLFNFGTKAVEGIILSKKDKEYILRVPTMKNLVIGGVKETKILSLFLDDTRIDLEHEEDLSKPMQKNWLSKITSDKMIQSYLVHLIQLINNDDYALDQIDYNCYAIRLSGLFKFNKDFGIELPREDFENIIQHKYGNLSKIGIQQLLEATKLAFGEEN